jgi:hypothetical protein
MSISAPIMGQERPIGCLTVIWIASAKKFDEVIRTHKDALIAAQGHIEGPDAAVAETSAASARASPRPRSDRPAASEPAVACVPRRARNALWRMVESKVGARQGIRCFRLALAVLRLITSSKPLAAQRRLDPTGEYDYVAADDKKTISMIAGRVCESEPQARTYIAGIEIAAANLAAQYSREIESVAEALRRYGLANPRECRDYSYKSETCPTETRLAGWAGRIRTPGKENNPLAAISRRLTDDPTAANSNPATALLLSWHFSHCVDCVGEGATCEARLGHDVVFLGRPERRLTQDVLDTPDIDRILA